jgi:hypothetical protein
MKVKVGDKIYDGANEPIMIILSDTDKSNIANMLPKATKYLSYPDSMSVEDATTFMETNHD